MLDRPAQPPPPLSDLGTDLLRISPVQKVLTLLTPFAIVAIYFTLAKRLDPYFRQSGVEPIILGF